MAVLNSQIADAINSADVSNGDFSPIPAGDYTLQVEETSIVSTRDGTGEFVKIQFSVLGPSYQNRRIFSNFNIRNKSAKAEDIGRAQLKMLSNACQIVDLRDTDQLVGKAFLAAVTVEKSKSEQYGDQNRVSKFRTLAPVGNAAPSMSTPQVPQDQDMPSGSSFSSTFTASNPQPNPQTANWFK